MEINRITLYNFGSYEGYNVIETNVTKSKNLVLFGGANGAGKTTLFKSIGLCLYGYTSLGYASQSNKYTKIIKSLINNKEKQKNNPHMSIELLITMENGQEQDTYTLTRTWDLNEELTEVFQVKKNEIDLTPQEIADFEKYLLSVIPPEMFNLYFFDGEKITDFFTDQDGNKRLKDAFLTICGYDTFDIMNKNFKRHNSKDKQTPEFTKYLKMKEINDNNKSKLDECNDKIQQMVNKITDIDSELELIEKKFTNSGGITEQEWNIKENELKNEEKNREEANYELKKIANDILPFIMIKKEIEKLKKSIINENKEETIENFINTINSDLFSKYFESKKKIKSELVKIAKNNIDSHNIILDLSFEQEANIMGQINKILSFNEKTIEQYKHNIEQSLKKSSIIRKEMNKLTSSNSNEYINVKKRLLEEKNMCLSKRAEYEQEYIKLQTLHSESNSELEKLQEILENEIKQESINNISIKATLMLDKLQERLYKEKIERLEKNLRKNISLMMTKDDLISQIMIDEHFVLHIYQDETLSNKDIIEYLQKDKHERLIYPGYITDLKTKAKKNKKDIKKMFANSSKKYIVPMEINVSTLSAGERQMLILSLYLSLVDLGNTRIPFVIDTPFARMDKSHRLNISKYFFSSLKGQVFILSTNKEIDKEHINIIGKKISKLYTLSNVKGSKTNIIKDKYF